MKILFFEVRHFSPNFHEFSEFFCQNPFQAIAIIRLKKKRKKKWHGPLSHLHREGKPLVVRPLKKNTFFMFVFP